MTSLTRAFWLRRRSVRGHGPWSRRPARTEQHMSHSHRLPRASVQDCDWSLVVGAEGSAIPGRAARLREAGWNVAPTFAMLPVKPDVGGYRVKLALRSDEANKVIQNLQPTTSPLLQSDRRALDFRGVGARYSRGAVMVRWLLSTKPRNWPSRL